MKKYPLLLLLCFFAFFKSPILLGEKPGGNSRNRVVVIGAGSIGLMSAYFLVKEGYQVTVIDKAEPASGASFGNAGFVVPSSAYPLAAPGMVREGLSRMLRSGNEGIGFQNLHHPQTIRWAWHFWRSGSVKKFTETSELLFSLGQESAQLHRDISEVLGGDIYQQSGRLELSRSEEAFEASLNKARRLAEKGISSSELQPETIIADVSHSLPVGNVRGLLFPEDGFIRPYVLLSSLADWLRKNGAVILSGINISDFKKDGNKIRGLWTSEGFIDGDEFLITAGFESNTLIKKFRARRLSLLPGAGYSLTIKNPGVKISRPVMLAESHVALTPLDDNRLRVAGVMVIGDGSPGIDQSKVEYLKGVVRTWFGQDFWKQNSEYSSWKGHRPCSPDGLPMIGRLKEYQNLSVATGHCTLGMHFGPVTGRIISSVLSGKPLKPGEEKLKPQRY